MFVRHHNQRTKKPKIPAAIQVRDEPALVLAERHRTTEQAVWKWRKRDSFRDRSPPRLQTTRTAVILRREYRVCPEHIY